MGWIGDFVEAHPTAVIGAIGSLGSSLTLLARWAWDRWRESRTYTLAEQADLRSSAQDILQEIPNISPALRALLVRVSNGGGALKEEGPLYITIEMEARQPHIRAVRPEWQQREAPESYRQGILLPLVQGANTHVAATDDILPGPLRDQHLLDGVKSTSIVVLHREVDGGSMWYLAVHTPVIAADIMTDAVTETTLVTRSSIARAAARITPLVRKLR
jgi:hypothetical protein